MLEFGKWLLRSKFIDSRADWPPDIMNIELTNKCNFSCDYCPVPKLDTEKGFMNMNLFTGLIDQVKEYDGTLVRLHVGGEPLLHPKFGEMAKYAKNNCLRIMVSTNGSLLDREKAKMLSNGFERVIISNPEKANREGLEYFKQNGAEPEILSQVMSKNPKRRPPKWADGWDIRAKHTWAGMVENPNLGYFCPCKQIWEEITVKWDGTVVPCCIDLENTMIVGDASKDLIREIWNGGKMRRVRKRHLNSNPPELCKSCEFCHISPIVDKIKEAIQWKSKT